MALLDSSLKAVKKMIFENWTRYLIGSLSLVVFVLVWQLYAGYLHSHNVGYKDWIPYPKDVFVALVHSFTIRNVASGNLTMTDHIFASLKRILGGFLVAVGLAVPLGLLMGTFRTVDAAARPIVEVIRPIPPLAWIPIFIVVLGSLWGPIIIVFLGIFFPVLLNVIFGVRSVDPILVDAARTLGAGRRQLFPKVVLPFTLPYLMTGIKVGLGIGWMCIVAAEMVGNYGGGVGWYIFNEASNFQFDFTFAGMIVIAILGILTTGVAAQVEVRLYKRMGLK